MTCCNQNCKQGRECPARKDGKVTGFTTIVVCVIIILLSLLTAKTFLS